MASTPSQSPTPTYTLYTYFRSSCAARIRIAANLKAIPLQYNFVDLGTDAHETEAFRSINPSAAVPVLVITDSAGSRTSITQSLAILEFFEESFNNGSKLELLPSRGRIFDRTKVRELVGIIATDLFPPTNSRVAELVRGTRSSPQDQIDFVHKIMSMGFAAYEGMLGGCAGTYSFGDEVTLADVVLAPAVDMAIGYKLDLEAYPKVMDIYGRLMELDAFKRASWTRQEDTPEKFREA